jgi:hypothetical protein
VATDVNNPTIMSSARRAAAPGENPGHASAATLGTNLQWDMAPLDPSLGKKMLFSSLGVHVSRCLEPSETCANPAIRAHSVQNSAVMDLLHRAGHVKVLTHDHHNADSYELIWRDVGRNLATTFEGFCSTHDAALFAPIDTQPLDLTDRQQLFLYGYRAVARELHALMEATARTQILYQQRIEARIDRGNEPEPAGILALEHGMNMYSTYEYKTVLDQAFLESDLEILSHEIVRLTPQAPAIAASVFFDLDTRRYQEEPPRAALNILPVSTAETVAIFSFTDADAKPVREYIGDILGSNGDYQKYLISRMLLLHAENFVVSPSLFDTWSEAKRTMIRDFSLKTTRFGASDQSPHFCLF